jgi:hypothetical protein
MKTNKIFGGMLLLAAAFTACNEDFTDWASPIVNPEPEAITIPGVTATAAAASVDLGTAGDDVQIISVSTASFPQGTTVEKMRVVFTPQDMDEAEPVTLQATNSQDGSFSKEDLQEMVVNYYGRRPEARSFSAHVYYDGMYNGQAAYIDAGTIELALTPEAPFIAENYYIVGGPYDWAESASTKVLKFSHSDLDVYEDPVFTIVFDAADSGDTWFAIGDDEGCDAIANNDWSKLFGIVGGESQATTGKMDYRYNLGADNSFCMPAGADLIKVVIDMMERTFEVTPIKIASQYYLVGALQGWSTSSMTCLFTPEADNVLSYTTKWTGDHNLKIWAAEDFGDWGKAIGTPVDGDESASGTLGGDGAIKCPEGDAYYTFTIDMNAMTYTWTKLDNQSPTEYSSISLIGEFNGWGGDFELEQVTPHNWYGLFTQEADGQLKYRANHDWSTNWGFGNNNDWDVTNGFNRIGTNGGGNIFVPAGTYAVYLNDITGSMMFLAQ